MSTQKTAVTSIGSTLRIARLICTAQGHNKFYTVRIRRCAGGRFQTVAEYGAIGQLRPAEISLTNAVVSASAYAAFRKQVDAKLRGGYRYQRSFPKGKALTAAVSAPSSKAALAASAIVSATPKVADSRISKKSKAPNAVIVSLAQMTDEAKEYFEKGDLVHAAIEVCNRCKGKDDECLYCEGRGQQVTVSDGIDGAPTYMRLSNVEFTKK